MNGVQSFSFSVIPGHVVDKIVRGNLARVVELVSETYLAHSENSTVNPPSLFLRVPGKQNSRIIALPAYVGGQAPISGIKWIASYPDNIKSNIPRASAVLLLNDAETGYPFACLESSVISAARTAASAALAAKVLIQRGLVVDRVAFIGAGVIARNIADFLANTIDSSAEVKIFDKDPDSSSKLAQYVNGLGWTRTIVSDSLKGAVARAQLVVFATTAGTPYISDPAIFSEADLILHISLRDLAPDIILSANNIVDDVDHCLTAQTSAHLTEMLTGTRDFVDGTLAEVMTGKVQLDRSRPTIFSPFGLGALDVALGRFVYEEAVASNSATPINDFFFERSRWASSAI